MNNWLKQRRKLCDEATPGPWSLPKDKTIQESPNDWLYTPYLWTATGGILSQYKYHTGAPKPDWDYIASHDPATMRLIYDVVDLSSRLVEQNGGPKAISLHIELARKLEALQNKVGGRR